MALLLVLSITILISVVDSQLAEECRHRSSYQYDSHWYVSYRFWPSFPPLSVNETSVDVQCCADRSLVFEVAMNSDSGNLQISVALREAHSASLPWTYSTILSVHCGDNCTNLWRTNYNNSLIGSHTFLELTPNTLYTVALLACYPSVLSTICYVNGSTYWQYSNITTKPEVPQFSIYSITSTSIAVLFQYYYYTGPSPLGHEVVVQKKDLNNVLSYSRYFQIFIRHAVISDLSPNTEYILHIRAIGSHHAGNYGRWKSVEVKTQPAVLTRDLQFTVSRRDTAVVLTLSPSLPYQHFDTFLFTWHQEGDHGTVHEANVTVEEGGVLFLEGLKQGQRYIGNWNGNSSFEFETTKNVELSTTGESVHLTWSPPLVTEGASITGYEASIATTAEMRVTESSTSLSSSGREIAFEGLQPLTVYEVELRVRVSSGSSNLLQPFYSANVTTVEKSNTEAVVNGVGGAAVMLAIVGVIIAIVVGGVIVGCFVRKKRRIQSPKQSEEGADDINMEKNPAYGDLNVKDQSPSREVDARYTTSGNPTGQQPYEEIAFHY